MLFASFWLRRPRMVSSASSGLSSTSRMSTWSNSSIGILLGQREMEGGAGIGLAVGPDSPTVPRDDLVHQREPDAGAGKVLVAVQALEHAEQSVDVARVESRAVVADEIDVLALMGDAADLDLRCGSLGRELDRVCD